MNIGRAGLLFYLSIGFIIAPKVNIVSFGSSGIRVEDLLLLLCLPILLWRYHNRARPFPSYAVAYIAFLCASFFSSLMNIGGLGPIGFVYTGRLVQYFLWFLIAAEFAPAVSEERFRKAFGFVAVVLLFWWLGEATHLLPKIGRFTGAGERITLNTSGPYETAILAVILAIMCPKVWQKVGMFGVLFATQSRVTLAAAMIVWGVARPARNLLITASLVPIIIVVLGFNSAIFSESRINQTQSFGSMLSDFVARMEYVPEITSLNDYRIYAVENLKSNVDYGVGDASFQVRAYKWAIILKSMGNNIFHFLFGWGPGAWGLAVDGNYVRFLGEGGIVGLVLAMTFFGFSLFGRDSPRPYRLSFLAMALSCLFIDAAVASKVMSTLWIIAGYYHSRTMFIKRRAFKEGI